MRGAEPGPASSPTHVVNLGRWLPRPTRVRLVEAAIPSCLDDAEQLIACLPSVSSARFRRVYVRSVGPATPLAIAVTTHRLLFFGVRYGWLDLIDAPARRDVRFVEEQVGRWRGGDDFSDVIVLLVREQRIDFLISDLWTESRALITEELTRPGSDPSSSQTRGPQ